VRKFEIYKYVVKFLKKSWNSNYKKC